MMSMPETRLTAFSIGRVTVLSIVSGDTLPYATLTVTTGGANEGKSATASRGHANSPSTTMAAESIATATRRVTANRAIDIRGWFYLPAVNALCARRRCCELAVKNGPLGDAAFCDIKQIH